MPTSGVDWPSVREELQALGTPERAEHEKSYLKSSLVHYGVPVPQLRKVARRLIKAHDLDASALEALTNEAWEQELYELRSLTTFVLQYRRDELGAGTLAFLEAMLRKCFTWALIDTVAIHVVGDVIRRQPSARTTLDRWASDDDFWIRRSAVLALLGEWRSGGTFNEAQFETIAVPMLSEKEFFIRKAIGWVLRDLSRKEPAFPAAFLLRHHDKVSGLTRREGAKYLSDAQRKAIGLT
ncbi:MAG: DNA alkylation repair protein [Myxococcota bacterium]